MKLNEMIAVLLCGLYVMFVPPTNAAELDQMQAATIYGLAHSVSGLPLPQQPPEIHMTSAMAIDKMLTEMGVCPRGCPSVKAAQVENRIYVDEKLDFQDIQNAAILFHEMVHFLQYAKDGEAKTCEEWRDREITAYQLQNLVLNKAGARMVQAPQMPTCPGDSKKKKETLPERHVPLEDKANQMRGSYYSAIHGTGVG
jgi:hypothetical protein